MKCDAEIFASLYETIYKDLYRFALCLMKNAHDAEDAVSEAVIAAYENIGKLKKPEAFKSWMFTIVSNVCKKKHKKSAAELTTSTDESAYIETNGEQPDYGLSLDVKQAFFILDEEEQFVVGLSVFGGYSSREIGEMLKLNPNTVRSKRKRALEKMECVLK